MPRPSSVSSVVVAELSSTCKPCYDKCIVALLLVYDLQLLENSAVGKATNKMGCICPLVDWTDLHVIDMFAGERRYTRVTSFTYTGLHLMELVCTFCDKTISCASLTCDSSKMRSETIAFGEVCHNTSGNQPMLNVLELEQMT